MSDLQRPQIVHQVPGVFGLNLVAERGHRRAVQTGHEDLVQVLVGFSRLEPRSGREIVGANRFIVAICGRRSGRISQHHGTLLGEWEGLPFRCAGLDADRSVLGARLFDRRAGGKSVGGSSTGGRIPRRKIVGDTV